MSSGFISDDSYHSQIRGLLIFNDMTFWQEVWDRIAAGLSEAGRFRPVNWIYLYGLYYITQDLLLMKSLTLLIICIDVLLFSRIIRTFTGSQNLAYLCAFLVPLFFQFRFWHDPILAFTFFLPMMCMLLFVSILFLTAYFEKKKKSYLICFVVVYFVSLLAYEITYSFIFCYVAIIFFYSWRKESYTVITSIALLTLLHIGIGNYFHMGESPSSLEGEYLGSKLQLDIIGIIHALYIQATAAIPLSWKFANAPFHQKFYEIGIENLIAYATFATLFCTALFKFDKNSLNKNIIYKIIFFSLCTLLGPALAIAASGHQKELIDAGFGYGYTPVFIQYFGLCVLFLLLLLFIKDLSSGPHYKKVLFVLIWLVVFSVGAITREENILIVKESNKFYKYPRELLGESIKNGLLDDVEEKDLVLRNHRYPSDYHWFYAMKTNKKINLCSMNIDHQFPYCLSEPYKIAKGFTCAICRKETIVLSSFKPAILMKKEVEDLFEKGMSKEEIYTFIVNKYGDEVVIPINENVSKDIQSKIYGVSYFLGDNYTSGSVLIAEILDIVIVEDIPIQILFKNYKIYNSFNQKLTEFKSADDMDFIKVLQHESDLESKFYDTNKFIATNIAIGFKNFHQREGDSTNYLRWSSGQSTLILYNKTTNSVKRKIKLSLIRPGGRTVDPAIIDIKVNKNVSKFTVDGSKNITFDVNINPGANYVQFSSDSRPINNGDPRNIVFGISNYKLN
ncbi:MAG: cytochrome c-type biogenesis protein CcmH [Thermodesulfobacteriota bacterium]|nr:cytochrome c-type biogenesis protein CcmH [Thermodesulfobacteriota bacterium]